MEVEVISEMVNNFHVVLDILKNLLQLQTLKRSYKKTVQLYSVYKARGTQLDGKNKFPIKFFFYQAIFEL
jgi:hypothetical protein